MMFIHRLRPQLSTLVIVCLCLFLRADTKSVKPEITGPPISSQTRMQLIRLMNAEFAFTRKPFPMGEKGLVLKASGELGPEEKVLRQLLALHGAAAQPGQRVQITNIEFKNKAILLEINGGPKKKAKWYQRIEVGGAGGMTPVAKGPDETVKGSSLTLEFKNHVPEMTLAQLQEVLNPVLDFTVKSAAQAYTETLPENVRNAIRDHKVLVGMNKEMVTYSKGRPPQRIREKDDQGRDYEEWIFGTPPENTEFVRFVGDQVVRLEIMSVDGNKTVRTDPEVQIKPATSVQAEKESLPGPKPGTKAPTLRRPGEAPPGDDQPGPMRRPADLKPSDPEPAAKPPLKPRL